MVKVLGALLMLSFSLGLVLAVPFCSNNLTICLDKPDGDTSYVNGTCNQYIVCVGGCANIIACPNNLLYSLSTHVCDYPQNVDCPWESTPPSGPSAGPSGTSCEQPGKCAGQPDGFMYANPNSNGYIVCQCECEIERPCADGTAFDEEFQTCGHINGTNVPTTPGPTTPVATTPAPTTPAPTTPAPTTPAPTTPAPTTPAPTTPAPTTPAPTTPAPTTPAPTTPAPTTPAPTTPGPTTPVATTPAPTTPAPTTPAPTTPAPTTPAPTTPAPTTPAPTTPAPTTPAPTTPAPTTPGPTTPVATTPAPTTPAPTTPAPTTPVPPGQGPPFCSNNLTICLDKPDGYTSYVNGTCNQYIVCVGGCANIITCPNNLLYSLSTHVCDYPQNVDCPWESTPPSGPSAGPSGTSCEQPGKCAGQPDGFMYANPNSNGYIVCQCECEIERPCADGTAFDEEFQTCGHINGTNVPTTPGPTTPVATTPAPTTPAPTTPAPTTPAPTTPGPTTPAPTTPAPTTPAPTTPAPTTPAPTTPAPTTPAPTTPGPTTPVATTPAPTTPGPTTPAPTTPAPTTPAPTTPSPTTPAPTTPGPTTPGPTTPGPTTPVPTTPVPTTPSGPSAGPSGTSCEQPGKCVGQPDGVMFANPNSNGYIVCQCECEIERPCADGTAFDEEFQTCGHINGSGSGNDTVQVTCDNDSNICKNQDEGVLFPIDGICNKFYKCNFGCAVEIVCPNNLVYDPNNEICDYPQNYICPWPYSPPSGPSAGPSGIACPSGGRCVGQREGTFFPSLNDCSKYVICQCECEVEMSCSAGLYWDNKLSVCNYSTAVTCALP